MSSSRNSQALLGCASADCTVAAGLASYLNICKVLVEWYGLPDILVHSLVMPEDETGEALSHVCVTL